MGRSRSVSVAAPVPDSRPPITPSRFIESTGKPVGVFGVSTDPISGIGEDREAEGGTLNAIRAKGAASAADHLSPDLRYIMDRAAFFFCRDTISRDYLKAQGVKTPILEFGPDAQLGMTLRDDARGFAWLNASTAWRRASSSA